MPIRMTESYQASRPLALQQSKLAVCMLAAGVAKRLEPISAVIAKPAFPLGGRVPIAELWVRKFVDAGISNFAMNLHRVPDSIRGYFGDGKRFLADITYVLEERPSGTLGGAIKMLEALRTRGIEPERVFIPSGDIVSGISVAELEIMLDQHRRRGAALTMMLAPIPWERRSDFGTAVLEGIAPGENAPSGTFARITDFVEKDANSPSNLNNASNYLIETSLLQELKPYLTEASKTVAEPCYDFGKHVLMGMVGRVPHLQFLQSHKGDLYGFEPGKPWFDVGNKRDYLAVNRAVLNGEIPIQTPYTRLPWGWIGENVDLDFSRVTINAPVIMGHNCTVWPGAEIGPNVVLGDGWVIFPQARIRDTVMWPHFSYPGYGNQPARSTGRIREVREGIEVETAVVVGGVIASDIRSQTVDVTPDGSLDIRSIDWLPPGERA